MCVVLLRVAGCLLSFVGCWLLCCAVCVLVDGCRVCLLVCVCCVLLRVCYCCCVLFEV